MICCIFSNLITFSPKKLTDYLYGGLLFLCHNLENGGKQMYVFANPNPHKLITDDCVIRAISLAEGKPWED